MSIRFDDDFNRLLLAYAERWRVDFGVEAAYKKLVEHIDERTTDREMESYQEGNDDGRQEGVDDGAAG